MKAAVALALVATAALLVPSAAHAQTRTDEDRAALARASMLVEAASQMPPGTERSSSVSQAVAALEQNPRLTQNGWLRDPLVGEPPDLAKARARLAAAVQAASSVQPRHEADAARRALIEVVSSPPFVERDWIARLPSWLVPAAIVIKALVEGLWDLIRWPVDRLLDLLGWLVGATLRGPAVVVLGLLVLAGLVLLYQRGLRSAIVRQAEMRASDQPLPPSTAEALGLASRHAGAGRYREACHFVFLATLLAIEERGHARFDPSATNREHLIRLAGLPPLARAMERVVGRFDRIWYGQDAVTEADYRELASLANNVSEAAA